jgi:hypothetical protein
VKLRRFELLTSCMPSQHSVTGMVRDVVLHHDDVRIGPGRCGMVATGASYRPGRARTWPSLRLAPDESLPRLAGQGLRLRQQATRRRRALARDLARLQDRAPEGWPHLRSRAPLLTLRRAARAVGRGGECASAPTWPEGAKGRQPAPGAPRSPPGGQPAMGGCRVPKVSAAVARRFRMNGGQPWPGARSVPLNSM